MSVSRRLVLAMGIAGAAWGAHMPVAMAQPAKFQQPPAFSIPYKTTGKYKGIGYSADSVLTWAPSGSSYQASMRTSKFGLGARTVSSVGQITANGLQPSRMSDGGGKTTKMSGGTVVFADANRASVPLQAGAQDQTSLAIQMAGMVAANPSSFTQGRRLSLQVVGINHAPVWQIVVGSPQAVTVAGKSYQAVHLRQVLQAGQEKATEVWLAPVTVKGQATYLPVRIRVSQASGEFVEQIATSLPQ